MINRKIKHQRMHIITILLFLAISCLATCRSKPPKPNKPQNHHTTAIKFYIQQQIPFNYYWLILSGQYQSDNYTTAITSLSDDIIKINNKISYLDKYTVPNKQRYYNANRISSSQGIGVDFYDEKFNVSDFRNNGTNFSHSSQEDIQKQHINQLKAATESLYRMRLSQLNIQFQEKYVLSQTIYVRLAYDRKQFALFIDHFKLFLKENLIAFEIAAIDKGSKYSYPINRLQEQQEQKEQNYDEQKLVQKINDKAEMICSSLNMKVKQIQSYKQINSSEIEENIDQQEQAHQDKAASSQQNYVNYYEGLQLKQMNKNEFEYENIIFQVQASCEANRKPQYGKVSSKSRLGSKQNKILIQDVKGGKQLLDQIQKIKRSKRK